MKCPYTVDSEQLTGTTYEYDDEGRVAKETHKLIEKRPFVECAKEECAAWTPGRNDRPGRCGYRGAVN